MIGIFGGSGFYSFLDNLQEKHIDTPYGKPSAPVMMGEYQGMSVAFLPRHGKNHEFSPTRVPYKANIHAFKQLGVTRIFGPCAAGSLKAFVAPGHFVVADQVVDRTRHRDDSFFNAEGTPVAHITFADPYCPQMRGVAIEACKAEGVTVHEKGTVVVIEGPRFSTRAESKWFQNAGWEVINMTQYPEAILAREQEMCYVNISLITDYDAGLEGTDVKPVTHAGVLEVFKNNNERLMKVLSRMIAATPKETTCECQKVLTGAHG
ncbi:MAG: hypothetical protein UX10_C0001G0022 [Candidatus Magasanikbacteria bacterium GW2011_GWA2_45_39]|uniref:Purine nucleoside phosphorylase n=2 Tax=Candidatus Magasanikiibacteriota TaxID=1752731 RepID=A0A0G1Q7C7_9BACT|nr:MAG: hypothetical protein UX10_C0001G0022 [Candidatus Magasanikbacteria bacterium GW2011_GWA2_45_39]KKU13608.1 MAG: hypothetical protein UX20_C0017G0026 [Candidatus Magasanikbacteria bacterium GW2011_GWC2_45_8]HBW73985.1 S-methyl-5'-thioadenosine phosphorylase [Candidatus Magasanikbacteria bacterium]